MFATNIASCVYREEALQRSLAEVHLLGSAVSGIFELSQENASAHLGIVAGAVVVEARNIEHVAQRIEFVALEVVEATSGT